MTACWEVVGGFVPGTPRPELTRRFFYSSEDKEADYKMLREELEQGLDPTRADAVLTIFQQRKDEAIKYWNELNDPRQHNWATLTWIWF